MRRDEMKGENVGVIVTTIVTIIMYCVLNFIMLRY
jgi:hypothetical protein